ncbi:uncharacterized protein METZ01_LOCUS94556, partial [marine metagenome]
VSQELSNVRFLLATNTRWAYSPASLRNRNTHTFGWNRRPGRGGATGTTESSSHASTG